MKSCPYCGAHYGDDAVACAADGYPLGNLPDSQEKSGEVATTKVRCPNCGATDDYVPAVDLRGSFSWLVFFAGGLLAVLFRNTGRQRRVRCNQCDALFSVRAPLSTLSRVIFWLLVCPTIIALIICLMVLLHAVLSH
jgi:uncharacterized Zn-finger protein